MNSLRILAFFYLFHYYILYLIIFFSAYFFGNYNIHLTFNTQGEAQMEMFIQLLSIPVIGIFAYDFFKRERNE